MKTPRSRPQTPLMTASSLWFERDRRAIMTAKEAHFGSRAVNLVQPFLCYNSLKTLSFHAKKLCPQTKLAAILKL